MEKYLKPPSIPTLNDTGPTYYRNDLNVPDNVYNVVDIVVLHQTHETY